MNTREDFSISLNQVLNRIINTCRSCDRDPGEVKLMAVTKTHPAVAAEWALEAGLRHIGENRVQEAAAKRPEVKSDAGFWELIGPLQRNKARLALETVDRIQTVDRLKLVNALDRLCGELGKDQFPVLLQVNTAEDPAKHGCAVEEAEQLATAILSSRHLRLDGLMTIGELTEDPVRIRATFRRLRELRDRLEPACGQKLPELSMGMTGDLELAIEEGSTLLRVGSALFGNRS
jgi:pyridoxal phosphate enzyme (YggS family)